MAKYKVLVGSHVVSTDPVEFANTGDVVDSPLDLVAKFGDNKFQLVEAEPVASEVAPVASEVAPQEGESKKGAKAK